MNFDDLMKLPADKAKAIFDHTTPPLPTETANTHQQAGEGWQERFDEGKWWYCYENGVMTGITGKRMISLKSFIASEIAAARESERQRITDRYMQTEMTATGLISFKEWLTNNQQPK